jgi:parallel beta-helix repeat protein
LRKHISEIVIALLLIGIFSSVFGIHLVKAAGTVYIRADGLVDPSSAPILNVGNVSYTFTAAINGSLVVERDNIAVDGAGHTLLGDGSGSGVFLDGRSNVTIKGITIEAFEYGIYSNSSSGNTLSANRIINNTFGIMLDYFSNNNNVSANNVTNSTNSGIWLFSSSNNGVSANNVTNNGYGILLDSSSYNTISANSVTNNNDYGIRLNSYSNGNSVSANNITNNGGYGVRLESSSFNSLSANSVANNNYYGIKLNSYSNGNSVSANNITNDNGYGIWLFSSSNNGVSANRITNSNEAGILLEYSNGNGVSANYIANSTHDGIELFASSSNSVSANNVTNGYYGIELYSASNNNAISANTIANNRLYGIHLASCSYNSISANRITNTTYYGIYLYPSSNNNSLSANYIANNTEGIVLDSSSSNSVSANNINNNHYGIDISLSDGNSVSANNVANNYRGIYLSSSSNNGVVSNNVTNNNLGIYLFYSASNSVWRNNIVGNAVQAETTLGYVNALDDGYPSGGNYWSDYAGVDLYKGPYQNVTGSDGIGDTPYVIDANNTDHYPLMGPWSPTLTLSGVTAWYWTSSTVINSVATGDVDGDGQVETVTGGTFYDGTRNVAQLVVWNSSSLTPERLTTWYWTGNTTINSIAIGDVNGDGQTDIVTGGYCYDGARQVAQLVVWNGSSLAAEQIATWYWTNNTVINSVALGDVDGDGQVEIVTGGYFNDGTRNVAQLVVWTGSDLSVDRLTTWYWTGNTVISSVAIGDVDADGQTEIVTAGYYNDGARNVAQLVVWAGSGLSVKRLTAWYWTGNTIINSVAIGDVDADGQAEIVTGGYFFDGARNEAQLVVWTGSALTVKRLTAWYWTGNTVINSVALGDMDSDGQVEIVTGGYFNDGTRNVAQLVAWSGSSLAVKNIQTWYWVANTVINSVCVNDVNGDFSAETVTGGANYDGTRWIAQLVVWGISRTV